MTIIVVQARVKPECVEAFKHASLENATHSVQEPGCARFDVIQQQDDPTRFVLYEAYRDANGHAAHRETAHYAKWRDAVNPMMAETRTTTRGNALHYSQ